MLKGCKDGVHKFRPRYDVVPNIEILEGMSCRGWSPQDLQELISKKTYIQDVCIKCGKIIERKTS